jgi:plastocyanin
MTKSGFSPATVTVTVGQTVRFVNGTDGTMRIYSVTNLGSPIYPGFDQGKSVGRGGVYDFLFNKSGTWGYYNLNGNSAVTGTVIANPQ